MRLLIIGLVLSFAVNAAAQSEGNAQAGKKLWDDNEATQCRNCHGINGEGALGPDLAGRKLTLPQFTRAVRTPWGVMPAFVESQLSNSELADIAAYLYSLPVVAQPGAWRFPLPAGASHGQEILLATAGCGQCHGPLLATPRMDIGGLGAGADFEWFKKMVYDHPGSMPSHWTLLGEPIERVRMGTFAKARLPESVLRELWTFVNDLGPRPRIGGALSAGVPGNGGVTYTLHVKNTGVAGKGLSAEDLTIALALPAGASVVGTTGAGYTGVRPDEQAKATVAVWQLSRLAAAADQTYTITLSRAATAADNLRGTIGWTKPAIKPGPADSVNIPSAPTAPATR